MIFITRILVTGGAGFIGTNLITRLINSPCHITILDNLDPQVHGADAKLNPIISPHVTFIKGDVRYYSHCAEALINQDIIIHLAADTATGQSMYEINKCTKSNINGTTNLLQCICNSSHHIKKFILASSRAVYGEGKYICGKCGIVYPQKRSLYDLANHNYELKCPNCSAPVEKVATDELTPLKPQSVYGITKLTQEQYVSVLGTAFGIPYTILRLQNVYGEGQSLINPYTGILSMFASKILSDKQIRIFEDGLESRDFIHVQDVVTAILTVMERQESQNRIFNIGSGQSTTLIEVVELLYKVFGKKTNYFISNEYRVGDIRHNYADVRAIHNDMGYSATISLAKGLSRYAKWVLHQEIRDNYYNNSIKIAKGKGLIRS